MGDKPKAVRPAVPLKRTKLLDLFIIEGPLTRTKLLYFFIIEGLWWDSSLIR
jgi:hypothetical protein